jgi:hypothetical protein
MGLSDIAMPISGLELLRPTREQSHGNDPKLVQYRERAASSSTIRTTPVISSSGLQAERPAAASTEACPLAPSIA